MRNLTNTSGRFAFIIINKNTSIMKKKLFYLVFTILGLGYLNAQEFKVGINAGLPVSVSNEYAAALDLSYLVNINEKFDIGLTTGFSYWFKKSAFSAGGMNFNESEDIKLIPIALTSQFNISNKLAFGIDLGYAIPFSSDSNYKSGFYFAPKIKYSFSESSDIVLGYRVAKLDLNRVTGNVIFIDMLTLGVEFKL